MVSGEADMMAEIFARGPIACEIDADPLHTYTVSRESFDSFRDKQATYKYIERFVVNIEAVFAWIRWGGGNYLQNIIFLKSGLRGGRGGEKCA